MAGGRLPIIVVMCWASLKKDSVSDNEEMFPSSCINNNSSFSDKLYSLGLVRFKQGDASVNLNNRRLFRLRFFNDTGEFYPYMVKNHGDTYQIKNLSLFFG